MIQHGERAGFAFESFSPPPIRKAIGEHLDGDGAIEPCVAGLVQLALFPGADHLDDLVRAKTAAGRKGHICVRSPELCA